MVTQIYKIRSEIWVAPCPFPKFGGPKHQKFGAISHNFAISGTQQDIVNRKTALQTTDTPAQADLIR